MRLSELKTPNTTGSSQALIVTMIRACRICGLRISTKDQSEMRAEFGQFIELVPDRGVVFTWGWIDHTAVPAGSTTVEIDLIADGAGTLLTLTNRGLPTEEVASHTAGWNHYLPRLALVASGGDPGPDHGPS